MKRNSTSDSTWASSLSAAITIGIAAIAFYAYKQHPGMRIIVAATTTLVALASLLVGGLAGFIFGIPKTIVPSAAEQRAGTTYEGNTNLEQISDWLTKILVGAGLVELGRIGEFFAGLSKRLAGRLGNMGDVVGPAVVILYTVIGFLLAYLWARIYLARELRDAAREDAPDSPLGQMNAALYQPPPGGFERAIEMGENLLKLGTPTQPRFWMYYAAAHGQRVEYLQQTHGPDGEMKDSHDQALNAVKKAIALDPTVIDELRAMWRPKPGSKDDDLVVFSNDPEFTQVLGG